MRSRWFIFFVLAVVTGCARKPGVVEPHVIGDETPAAFQRAIGLSLLQTGQARAALPYLQRLVRFEPRDPAPLCYVSRAFMDMAMWQQARTSLDQAIALQPRYAPAHGLLGVLLDSRGDHAGAVVAHRKAAALEPNNAAYHNNIGFSLYLAGRYSDALGSFNTALRIGPSAPRIHNNIGFALGKLGRIDEATGHFRLGGTPAEAANNLGMVYEERGQLERAYEAYAEAVAEAPELGAARGNLERICARLGKPVPVAERRE